MCRVRLHFDSDRKQCLPDLSKSEVQSGVFCGELRAGRSAPPVRVAFFSSFARLDSVASPGAPRPELRAKACEESQSSLGEPTALTLRSAGSSSALQGWRLWPWVASHGEGSFDSRPILRRSSVRSSRKQRGSLLKRTRYLALQKGQQRAGDILQGNTQPRLYLTRRRTTGDVPRSRRKTFIKLQFFAAPASSLSWAVFKSSSFRIKEATTKVLPIHSAF